MQNDPDGSAAEQSPTVFAFSKSSEASQFAAGQKEKHKSEPKKKGERATPAEKENEGGGEYK
jgi:hypothetical protein